MRIAVFHNLPSGGALKALSQKMRILQTRGHHLSFYSFSTAEDQFVSLPVTEGEKVILPLRFEGPLRFRAYAKATRLLADWINRSDAEWVLVGKCRFFGSPPILQYLKKPSIFYSQEPLRVWEYERLAEGGPSVSGGLSRMGSGMSPVKILGKAARIYERWKIIHEDRKSIRCARLVMTNSHYTSRWLERSYGVKAGVNYLGVDSGFFSPEPLDERKYQVMSVGRMDPTKGYDFLLRVVSLIPPARRPKWLIVCDAVDEDYFQRFRKEAVRLGVVDYEIRCRIPEWELRELYCSTRLVLCASVHEPFGLVPLEAMACGTPVVAVREGGYEETVRDGETGILLDRSEPLWADILSKYLVERNLARELGRSGRQYVERNWTWESFADRLEKELSRMNSEPAS